MEIYKEDIIQSRVGCLGSSDGNMLQQICALGYVPKSAHKRLAVCKGLIPQEEIPRTAAIQAGDAIEMLIYKHISAEDPRYESNPRWESVKYSTKNVKLISHPDFVLRDDARKTLFIYECKATKYGVEETRQTYKSQLFIHNILGKEICESLGKDWNVKVFLVHYNTDGLDLAQLLADNGLELDPTRLTVREVRFTSTAYFNVKQAMTIVDAFLETFTEFYEGDEIDANLLPQKVKAQFTDIAVALQEMEERKTRIDEFKKYLFDFMTKHNIKSIKNEFFSITRVDPSVSKAFDGKRFLEDLQKEHPRKAKKISDKYTKTSNRSGYCNIKVKETKEK